MLQFLTYLLNKQIIEMPRSQNLRCPFSVPSRRLCMPYFYLQAQLQSRHEKSAVLVSSHYIVLNVAWNAILHILLWLVLTFYCWDCTKILSLTKLIYCFPVTIALWLINFILTIYVWKKSIKPILGSANPPHIREHEQSEEDSMGPQSQNWDQSAKTVYSTQL